MRAGVEGSSTTRRDVSAAFRASPSVFRTRLGARLTRANVEFDDHPSGDRFAGRIATVTVDSVFDWLSRTQRGGPLQTVR